MENISVSEIPLPGEDNNYNSDDISVEPVGNSSIELKELKSEANESTHHEIIKSETVIETDLQNFEPNEVETTEDFKENNTDIIEIQIVESDSHNNSNEINEIVVHADNITSELLQDVVNSETIREETIDEVTSEIITETVDVQMEVHQNVEEPIEEICEETKLEIETITQEDDTMESLKFELDSSANVSEISQSETHEIVLEKQTIEEIDVEVDLEQTEAKNSETETNVSGENLEISIEEATNPKPEPEKIPAKKISRTNSTIEAIKNDWSDGLTIEENSEENEEDSEEIPGEISEEIPEEVSQKIPEEVSEENPEEVSEEIPEEVSHKIPEEVSEEISEEVAEEIPEEVSQNIEPVINKSEKENVSETTEVIVFETEEISENIENITIEIVDEGKSITIKDSQTEQNVIEIVETRENVIKVDKIKQDIIEVDKIQEKVIEESNKTEKVDKEELVMKENCEIVENSKESSSLESETIYIIQEVANNNKPDSSANKTNKRAKNKEKPEKLQIPCHVLGRNVDNPTEDLVSNGRTPPKPRLGVKVPYRFLTSQIVSKQDIANELIEITSKRNPDPDPPAGGDIFFASKLTQRLASKIAQGSSRRNKKSEESSSGIPAEALTTSPKETSPSSGPKSSKNPIGDKSDLLAILEGDVEVDWTKELRNSKQIDKKPTENSEIPVIPQNIQNLNKKYGPNWEKELALKQLRELPKLEGRGRPRKHFYIETTVKESPKPVPKIAPEPTKDKKVEPAPKTAPQLIDNKETTENLKQPVTKVSKKITQHKEDKIVSPVNKSDIISDKKSPKTLEDRGNDDPILTPIRVTKTYSRKEAFLDVPADLEYIVNELEPSSALAENPDENKEKSIENQDDSTQNKQEVNKSENVASKQNDNTEKSQLIRKSKRNSMEINKPEVTLVSKRARIIKRKVIWDPAEIPKTRVLNAIRRAQAQELKSKKNQSKGLKIVNQVKTDPPEINTRQLRKKKILPTKKFLMKRQLRSLTKKLIRSSNGDLKSSLALTKKKKQVIAEIAKKVKPKKTELDKLLGDEGAVNMLYSVRQNKSRGMPIKSVSSRKELQNRTKVVKEVITQNLEGTPKTLRKKENQMSPLPIQISTPLRKKSRDSVRSSLQSPPPSPSYLYPQRADASRIIRRHSSSFSSECSSPRRLSVDQQQLPTDKPETTEESSKTKESDFQSPVRILRRKGVPIFERKLEEKTYKGKKKILTDTEPKSEVVSEKTVSRSEKLTLAEKRKLNSEMSKNFSKSPPKKRAKKDEDFEEVKNEIKLVKPTGKNIYKEISLKKNNNLVQILLTPSSSKLKNCINLQMFKELCEVLAHLATDENCRVLLITSTDSSFCHGVDFSALIQPSAEKRLNAAQELASALKDFISTLAHFPKPLIAGIQGSAVGLGVTMLPLFDLVFASDKATFSAPYGRLGQVPEGAAFLTLPSLLGNTLTSELVFANRKLTASEALHHGLVTRVLWPDKFKDELVSSSLSVAGQSLQCMMATKSLLRQSLLSKLDEALKAENKLLVEHWTSTECQQNFKNLLQEEEWW